MIESVHQKFPALSKNSIRNKVKEIADFVDNHHWQVGEFFFLTFISLSVHKLHISNISILLICSEI